MFSHQGIWSGDPWQRPKPSSQRMQTNGAANDIGTIARRHDDPAPAGLFLAPAGFFLVYIIHAGGTFAASIPA
jgi:hypothetical protein